jgi:hypothetical protein
LLKPRAGKGGAKLINIAEFDRAAGEATDAVRELNGSGAAALPAPGVQPGDPILAREQARRVSYEADLKKIDLEERLGRIAPLDRVRAAVAEFAQVLGRVIETRPSRVEDIIAANAKGGMALARAVEKDERRALRADMAKAMDSIAEAAESESPAVEDDLAGGAELAPATQSAP